MIKAIVAIRNPDGAIGHQDALIHHDKFDMRNFAKVTKEAGVIVMGRKTAESLRDPLPNRINYVISKTDQPKLEEAGFIVITLKEAEELLEKHAGKESPDLFIVGGATIYNLFKDLIEFYSVTIFGASGPFQKELMEKPADAWLKLDFLDPYHEDFHKWDVLSRTFVNPNNKEIVLYEYQRIPG